MSKVIGVYDHDLDTNGLHGIAIKFPEIDVFTTFEDLYASSNLALFVHVDNDDWKRLCDDLSSDRFALRFATEQRYSRSPPEGRNRNCFLCLKPINGDGHINLEEFRWLVEAFSDPNIPRILCIFIPENIRSLVACSTTHRLRALHILLQACMMEWVSSKDHKTKAVALLGFCPMPSSVPVPAVANRAEVFFRALTGMSWPDVRETDFPSKWAQRLNQELQQELGVDRLGNEFQFLEILVKEVLGANDGKSKLTWGTASGAFRTLDQQLGRRRSIA